jgi:hypothetical protein
MVFFARGLVLLAVVTASPSGSEQCAEEQSVYDGLSKREPRARIALVVISLDQYND